jgi:hypothetical protein
VVLCCLTAIVCVVGFLFIQSNITHSYYVGGGAIATSTTIVSDETPDGDYEGQLTNDESGVENSSEMQTSLTGNAEHEEEEKNVLIWVIVSLVAVLVIESYLTYKFWTKYEHKNDKIAY